MKQILLWLDDYRDPYDTKTDWLVFSPIGKNINIVWVKNYNEFINWISINKLPNAICFDHDLPDVSDNEKTEYDCAKWLIEFCLDNKTKLPIWNCQSANPVGRDNINGLLNSFIKNVII